jgi:hypothetical protein
LTEIRYEVYPLRIGDRADGARYAPVFHQRLLASEFWLRVPAEVQGYAMRLWFAALTQDPAGALPDDDAVLAALAGLGRDVAAWRALRAAGALYGWRVCGVEDAEGEPAGERLWHPVVAEMAQMMVGAVCDRPERAAAATARKRLSRVVAHLEGLRLAVGAAERRALPGQVLDWLDSVELDIRRANVVRALDQLGVRYMAGIEGGRR